MNVKNIVLTFVSSLLLSFAVLADDIGAGEKVMSESITTVNINTADADTLASVLSGVGVSRAYAIVEYREMHGKFYSAEELSSVRGIGMTTISKNADKIKVD